jgi:hypothetical protein
MHPSQGQELEFNAETQSTQSGGGSARYFDFAIKFVF